MGFANFSIFETERINNLQAEGVSRDIAYDLIEEQRELIQWKEQQGIF